MSIKSWRKEFIPTPAARVPKEEAVAHCLQRWIGYLPENLGKHRVSHWAMTGRPGEDCSLCNQYGYDCCTCRCVELVGEGCCTPGGPLNCLEQDNDPTSGIMLLEIMLLEGM